MAMQITSEQTDWLTGFLARARQGVQPGIAVDTAGSGAMPGEQGAGGAPDQDEDGATNQGAGGAHNQGEGGAQGANPGDPGVNYHWAEIDKRHAERDAERDEYGIEKPAVSWTEKLIDDVAPPEIVNDPETPWFETMGRALAVAPAFVAGHFMDNVVPLDTRLHAKLTLPILSEIAEGEEQAHYRHEREEYERELRQDAAEHAAKARESEAADDQPPGPWAEGGSCPAPDQGSEDTRPPGPWADDAATAAPEAATAPADAPAEARPPGPWAEDDAPAAPDQGGVDTTPPGPWADDAATAGPETATAPQPDAVEQPNPGTLTCTDGE